LITGDKYTAKKINERLNEQLDILADNAKFYSGGDIVKPRHDASLVVPSLNVEQQQLATRRYVEIEAALDAFNHQANRYLAPSVTPVLEKTTVSSSSIGILPVATEPRASAGDHPVDYLQHSAARVIVQARIDEHQARQQQGTALS
jgi:hypothetical protein